MCVRLLSFERNIPGEKQATGILPAIGMVWGEEAGNETGKMKPRLDIQLCLNHCECGFSFHYQCSDLGTLTHVKRFSAYTHVSAGMFRWQSPEHSVPIWW